MIERMKMRLVWTILALFLSAGLRITACAQTASPSAVGVYRVKVLAAYPHDPSAFTQGLIVHAGHLYEGTGLYGNSSIRRLDLETGKIERMTSLANAYFGEGITVLGNRLYQLTWREHIVIIYDVDTLKTIKTLKYDGDGWGLTSDGTHLILSDGSAFIRFLNPENLSEEKRITVHEGAQPVDRLNELEYIKNEIWANIWYKDKIARISPVDGKILGWIDLSDLYPRAERQGDDVLNGIAFDSESDRLFVTGKNWPWLYKIEVVRP